MELGLKRGTVALIPHRREWEDEAERIANELRGILGDLVADVQHVGSTSIATIMAKPDEAKKYEALKVRLANECPTDADLEKGFASIPQVNL